MYHYCNLSYQVLALLSDLKTSPSQPRLTHIPFHMWGSLHHFPVYSIQRHMKDIILQVCLNEELWLQACQPLMQLIHHHCTLYPVLNTHTPPKGTLHLLSTMLPWYPAFQTIQWAHNHNLFKSALSPYVLSSLIFLKLLPQIH